MAGQCDEEVPPPKGGKAAERLREFLAARFGDKAPTIPPDEDEPDEHAQADADEQAGPSPVPPP